MQSIALAGGAGCSTKLRYAPVVHLRSFSVDYFSALLRVKLRRARLRSNLARVAVGHPKLEERRVVPPPGLEPGFQV